MEKFDQEKRIEAKWCYDSETGEKMLIDMISGQILVRGKNLKDMAFSNKEVKILEEAEMWRKGFDEGYETARQDFDYLLVDLEDKVAYLKEERDYLLSLNRGEDTIQ